MTAVADLTLQALPAAGTRLRLYAHALANACEVTPPPYGQGWYGRKYRREAADPAWLARSLLANADKEAQGARKLWSLAGEAGDAHVAEQVRVHALDEARHARLYVALIDLVFPGAMDPALRSAVKASLPNHRPTDLPAKGRTLSADLLLDQLIQMNIGEIRTRIHQLLLQPVLRAYCPLSATERVRRVLDALMIDETRHIDYTATLIEGAMRNGQEESGSRVFHERLADFNRITLEEVGSEGHE